MHLNIDSSFTEDIYKQGGNEQMLQRLEFVIEKLPLNTNLTGRQATQIILLLAHSVHQLRKDIITLTVVKVSQFYYQVPSDRVPTTHMHIRTEAILK